MKMTMKSALKKVESSKEDKLRDKKLKIKEGSKRDMATDKAQAKRMMKKSK
jgi:cell division protein YceG involved in septum cleavage